MFDSSQTNTLPEAIFPSIKDTILDLEVRYPSRNGKITTRFAPSPTGFLHVGGLYSAYVGEKFAHQNEGVFILRIENTDQKRQTDTGISDIIDGLKKFNIMIDEGPENEAMYGPYIQSQRKDIYSVFAKDLVKRNLAYPCFLNETEIQEIRDNQTKFGLTPGIYGEFSPWAKMDFESIIEKLQNNQPFVLRWRCHGNLKKRVRVHDEIHGSIEMQDNYADVVLLKSDGIPTYHFAHIVDDYLMRTTHVIRGDEWIPSLPLHIQLFEAFGIAPPKYVHMAPLMKMENGNKRKLSKRKDPEANVEYFFLEGYPVPCIKDYLLNILDSNYDNLRISQVVNQENFALDFSKMPKSGALFDLKKLESISHQYLSSLSNEELFQQLLDWSAQYDKELNILINNNRDLSFRAISIQRGTERDPKKFKKFGDFRIYLSHFIPELFEALEIEKEVEDFDNKLLVSILQDFRSLLDTPIFSQENWLDTLKIHAEETFSVASNNQKWKTGNYALKFGDYIMIIRLGITKSKVSPDLREMIQVLGNKIIQRRIDMFIEKK